ncbi:MAG: helix-turn-helix domain-containing protein [Bacteroidota bacterium]|jgi:AraC-like DNA-binding protein
MFTPQYLLLSLDAGVLSISLLVFIDLLIKFKRPLVLKSLLLLMVACIGLNAFGQIFQFYYNYSRVLIELPIHILSIACINFIYQLYRNKLSRFVLVSCLLIFLLVILIPLYYNYKFGLNIYTTNYYLHPKTRLSTSIVRIISGIYILSLCIYYLYNILEKYNQANIYFRKLRLWCVFMIGVLVVSIIVGILKFSFPYFFPFKFLGNIVLLAPLVIILYRPAFLNKMPVDVSFLSIFSSQRVDKIPSDTFANHFFTNLYYLKEKCTAAEFSEILGVDQETLNNYIKIYYDTSFTDLVNKYRILYFIDLANNPESKLFTIDALAKQAGFSSRQNMAFFFKKFHGGSPSDYVKHINSN